jgi:hypothetical protein
MLVTYPNFFKIYIDKQVSGSTLDIYKKILLSYSYANALDKTFPRPGIVFKDIDDNFLIFDHLNCSGPTNVSRDTRINEDAFTFFYIDFSRLMAFFHPDQSNTPNIFLKCLRFEVTDEVKTILNNNTGKILLDTSTECIRMDKFDWNYFFNLTKLKPKNFILLTGDASNQVKANKIIPTIYRNTWERLTLNIHGLYDFEVEVKVNNIINKKLPRWHALCLNRITKIHRIYISNFISKHGNLRNKINYSFGLIKPGAHEHIKSKPQIGSEKWYTWLEDIERQWSNIFSDPFNEVEKWMVYHQEKYPEGDILADHTINMNHQMCQENYYDSVFNIVTESFISADLVFLTEKTFKPIIWHQPFIMIGNPGSIEFLRTDGFDVFDDIIDHSYDNIIEIPERFEYIKKEIIRLCDIPISDWVEILHRILPRLRKNYSLFRGASSRHNIRNEML